MSHVGARSERSTFVTIAGNTCDRYNNRVIRDNARVCQRDSSQHASRMRSTPNTAAQCCRRERCVSVFEVIGQAVVSEYVS
eukprot:4179752-Prymnesium_polylepis.2